MTDFKLKDCAEKLESLEKKDRAAMLWQWIKHEHINLAQFKELIKYCL